MCHYKGRTGKCWLAHVDSFKKKLKFSEYNFGNETKQRIPWRSFKKYVNGSISRLMFEFCSGTDGLLRSWVGMLIGVGLRKVLPVGLSVEHILFN